MNDQLNEPITGKPPVRGLAAIAIAERYSIHLLDENTRRITVAEARVIAETAPESVWVDGWYVRHAQLGESLEAHGEVLQAMLKHAKDEKHKPIQGMSPATFVIGLIILIVLAAVYS